MDEASHPTTAAVLRAFQMAAWLPAEGSPLRVAVITEDDALIAATTLQGPEQLLLLRDQLHPLGFDECVPGSVSSHTGFDVLLQHQPWNKTAQHLPPGMGSLLWPPSRRTRGANRPPARGGDGAGAPKRPA